MIRQIIKIDEKKCNGCGLCVSACHEGAIAIVDGKARLLRDDYCDGLGNCLPVCPVNAISFEEREAAEYDEDAVLENQNKKTAAYACACPGSAAGKIDRQNASTEAPHAAHMGGCPGSAAGKIARGNTSSAAPAAGMDSCLSQWPVQIKLVPVNAPYFDGAKLLVAADCTAYAYGNFHNEFIRNHITLIGCPKLDEGDYTEKLAAIITNNDIKSLTVVRMEVPCCGGIEHAAREALRASGKLIPWQVVTISRDGIILD